MSSKEEIENRRELQVTAFQKEVMREMEEDPTKSTFLFEGIRLEEVTRRLASRDLRNHAMYFDGYRFDQFRGAFNITCQKDFDDLINLLTYTKHCFMSPKTAKP